MKTAFELMMSDYQEGGKQKARLRKRAEEYVYPVQRCACSVSGCS